ncbi:unnamed protein product [Amoebophrya sp. A25]|nr:unnamed protein product [Amoebophrya sp. A25]|eukprot:GSA25T00000877001.1
MRRLRRAATIYSIEVGECGRRSWWRAELILRLQRRLCLHSRTKFFDIKFFHVDVHVLENTITITSCHDDTRCHLVLPDRSCPLSQRKEGHPALPCEHTWPKRLLSLQENL